MNGNLLVVRETPAVDVGRLLDSMGESCADDVRDLAAEAADVASPVSLTGMFPVSVEGDRVTVGETVIRSGLMAKNFAGLGRVFPYVVTCGRELEEWSAQYRDDPLAGYIADELKKLYLRAASAANTAAVRREYGVPADAGLSSMNPGSLGEWPIDGQKELFAVLGGKEAVFSAIGVELTASMLMVPTKSGSGILFENSSGYVNCRLCPMKDCPNRRAVFDPSAAAALRADGKR